MDRRWALSPWLQVPLGLVLLAVGLYAPWLAAQRGHEQDVLDAGRVCDVGTVVGSTDTCLVPVPGRLDDRRGRTSLRYHFAPDDVLVDDDWVRFPGDESSAGGATGRLVSGAHATALYAGDEVVAFDVDGERVREISGESGSGRTSAWGGLWLGSLGAMMLVGAWHRRPRPDRADGVAPSDFPSTGRLGLLGLGLLAVMLGSFAAFFAGSLRSELVTFAAVAGLMGALVVVGRARQRSARSRPGVGA